MIKILEWWLLKIAQQSGPIIDSQMLPNGTMVVKLEDHITAMNKVRTETIDAAEKLAREMVGAKPREIADAIRDMKTA